MLRESGEIGIAGSAPKPNLIEHLRINLNKWADLKKGAIPALADEVTCLGRDHESVDDGLCSIAPLFRCNCRLCSQGLLGVYPIEEPVFTKHTITLPPRPQGHIDSISGFSFNHAFAACSLRFGQRDHGRFPDGRDHRKPQIALQEIEACGPLGHPRKWGLA